MAIKVKSPVSIVKKYPRHLAKAFEYLTQSAWSDKNMGLKPTSRMKIYPICKIGDQLKPPRTTQAGPDFEACTMAISDKHLEILRGGEGVLSPKYANSIVDETCRQAGGKVAGVVYVTDEYPPALPGIKLPVWSSKLLAANNRHHKFDCFINEYGEGYCITYAKEIPSKVLDRFDASADLKRASDIQLMEMMETAASPTTSAADQGRVTQKFLKMRSGYVNSIAELCSKKYLGQLGQIHRFSLFAKSHPWPNGYPGQILERKGTLVEPGLYSKGMREQNDDK